MRAWASLAIVALTAAPALATETGRKSVHVVRFFGQPPRRGGRAARTAPLGAARLQGQFELRGRVTVAHAMAGEHVGEIVQRSWTFVPQCAAGPCQHVLLLRARANGTDMTMLSEHVPGDYAGASAFFAPLRCGARTYAHGELVPFRITVQVTADASPAGTIIAVAVSASYTNRTRTNLTPCVDVHRHDAAAYTGELVAATGSAGA